MNKFNLIKVFTLALVVVFLSSCKDDEVAPASVESQLIGTWMGDEYYEDGELSDWNAIFKAYTIDFLEDGTGEELSVFGTQSLTWSYEATTEKLTIITADLDTGDGLVILGDTIVADIVQLDDVSLWFKYNDGQMDIEERYRK